MKRERDRFPNNKIVVMGIDAGSTYMKVLLLDSERKVLAASMGTTGSSHVETSHRLVQEAVNRAGLSLEEIAGTVLTGYGRRIVSFPSGDTITEISCHARGAYWLFPQVQMVVDVGGQDSKVIVLDEKGQVSNFIMNDKCAAGTGRFLEVMSRTLHVSLDEMGILASRAKNCAQVSSVCTVFAESEVVSLLAAGEAKEDIIAGVFESIAKRILGMISRAGGARDLVVMTGGVARSEAAIKSLERTLGKTVLVPAEPQQVGALGAALIALERVEVKKNGGKNRI